MTINAMNTSSSYPLLQWYARAQLIGLKAGLMRAALTGTASTVGYNRAIAAERAQIAGLGQLSSAVSTFQTAMQGLESPSAVAPAQASSTNSAVAAASAQATAAPATYAVTIGQLAQSQVTSSAAVVDPNATLIGSGTLTVQLGNYNAGTNTFTAGASAPVSITVTNGSLNSIASAINAAGAGVSANVVQDVSGFHLVLSSTATGAANAFKITAADLDGVNTDMTGLSQLAYDPTATAGAGKNLTLNQVAQDASLSVNGVAQTSASNAGVSIASGVTLNLFQVGSTTVSVSQNTAAIQSAAQNFVDAYNALVATTTSLIRPGGALAGGVTTTAGQLLRSMNDTDLQSFTGVGSMTSLARMGITPKADGTLSLDANALQAAVASNAPGTVAVLNQAAQAFDAMAGRYASTGGEIPAESQQLQTQLSYMESVNSVAQIYDSLTQAQANQSYQAALRLSASDQFMSLWKTLGYA
jgi:flagellar hook-associated protein 2